MRLFPLLPALCAGGLACAETLDEASRALARRVASRLGPADRVALQVRALTPVPAAEREQVERAVREIVPRAGAGGVPVRLTISAALDGRVLIAEFVRGEEAAVMMGRYDVGSAPADTARAPRARPLLERTLIWEQRERILDASLNAASGEFWALDAAGMTLRNREGEVLRQVPARTDQAPLPRDPRGRIAFDAAGGEPRALLAGAGNGEWPVARGLTAAPAGENEFALNGARFFTAARVSPGAVLLAGVGGRLRWVEPGAPVREVDGAWGSEIASLANACGGGSVLVVASARDGQSLGLWEAVAATRALRPAGEPMNLPGTLSALWPAEGDAAVTAIVRTAAGRYAAYRVFAGCGR